MRKSHIFQAIVGWGHDPTDQVMNGVTLSARKSHASAAVFKKLTVAKHLICKSLRFPLLAVNNAGGNRAIFCALFTHHALFAVEAPVFSDSFAGAYFNAHSAPCAFACKKRAFFAKRECIGVMAPYAP